MPQFRQLVDALQQVQDACQEAAGPPLMLYLDGSAWSNRLTRLDHALERPIIPDWRAVYRMGPSEAQELSDEIDLLDWVCAEAAHHVLVQLWQVYVERAVQDGQEQTYLAQAASVVTETDSIQGLSNLIAAPSAQTAHQLWQLLVSQSGGAWREQSLLWEHLMALILGDLAKELGEARWVPQLAADAVADYVRNQAQHALPTVIKTHGVRLADQVLARLAPMALPLVRLRGALLGTRKQLGSPAQASGASAELLSPLVTQSFIPEGYLPVLNHHVFHSLRSVMAQQTFTRMPSSPWPTTTLNGPTTRVELRPARSDLLMSHESSSSLVKEMWQQRTRLTDLDADILDLLSALWLQQAYGPMCEAVADVDQLLALRGLQPKLGGQGRRGGFEPEQRDAVIQAVQRIQSLWIQMDAADVQSEGRLQRHVTQSRAFVVSDYEGLLSPDGETLRIRRFLFRPGALFARFLFGPGRHIALLSSQAVQYNPHNCIWEKRLTRQFSWLWGMDPDQGSAVNVYRVGELLKVTGMTVDERLPLRTRERFEYALDRLHHDRVVAGWQYDRWREADLPRRGWLPHWLQASIVIEPPDEVKQFYMTCRSGMEDGVNRSASQTIGDRLRIHRGRQGLTQLQTAEALGIHPLDLSRFERGEVRPPGALEHVMEQWLNDSTVT